MNSSILRSLINDHTRLLLFKRKFYHTCSFFNKLKTSTYSPVLQVLRVNFPSYPFIQAYPFIRDLRVCLECWISNGYNQCESKQIFCNCPLIHRSLPKTSPSESTISSSSPVSLTTFLTYLSALEVMVLHTGGKICEIHEDIVFGTFLTKTVKANRNERRNQFSTFK